MARPNSLLPRLWAICEVVLAFGAVHLAFRAFRRFTPLGRAEAETGLNFSFGALFILFALALILIPRRRPSAYGLTARRFFPNVAVGVLCFIVFVAGGLVVAASGVRSTPATIGPFDALILAGAGLAMTCAFLWMLRRRPGLPRRIPPALTVALILAILAAPIIAASATGRAAGPVVLAVLWRTLGAGIGEEVFFRGYIQSRINHAFGRPWRLLGVRFGVGLIVSTLLFAFIHALNTVDYFGGTWRFAWWHALATLGMPYAFLREKTGSVVAPATLHALLDVLALLPMLLAAQ